MNPPSGDTLCCRAVPDGVVFDNLKPGRFLINGEMYPYLMKMSSEGALWPYKAFGVAYTRHHDVWTVEIEEGK